MIKKIFLVCLWFSLLLPTAVAETSPQPTAPFLARMPADFCWRMDFTQGTADSPAPSVASGTPSPAPNSSKTKSHVLVARSKGVFRELTTWSDGTQTDLWSVEQTFFLKEPDYTQYAVYLPQDNPNPGHERDFRDLEWLTLNNFQRVEMKNGQKCFVYSTSHRETPYPAPTIGDLGAATVWVNINTKLPVAWQEQICSATYTFNLPSAGLELPEECQKVMDAIHAYRKRMAGQKMVLPQ